MILHLDTIGLATPKVLSLDNKNKLIFILYCARLIVPLASPKVLSFGNEKKNLFSFCISLTYYIKSSRSDKQIYSFLSHLIRFFVPLSP